MSKQANETSESIASVFSFFLVTQPTTHTGLDRIEDRSILIRCSLLAVVFQQPATDSIRSDRASDPEQTASTQTNPHTHKICPTRAPTHITAFGSQSNRNGIDQWAATSGHEKNVPSAEPTSETHPHTFDLNEHVW
jgi:hypothetical protein